jgi:Arabinose efflux permease
MIKKIRAKAATPAVSFVILMGIVSLFADMTYEGARSIYGAYLPLLGASATVLGFVTGLGEFIGYALRLITGFIADKTKNYWGMTLLGYGVNLVAIPFLALVSENGWIWACALIILERTGKAIRQPAKNTLLSFAATQVGVGKSFAFQEFLDQLGAFSGPVLLFCVLWLKGGDASVESYAICFAVLGVPALITMFWLILARRRFPNPEKFEKEQVVGKFNTKGAFILYLAAITLFACGFVDFPLITMHVARQEIFTASTLPLLYAGAMIVDAFAALFFGWLYDRIQFKALVISGLCAAFFAVFIFWMNTFWGIVIGIILWGIGMGAQESILKAAVVTLAPKENRSSSFGVFESCFGLGWFLGSWFMGWLYDVHPMWLVVFSVAAQLAAIPLYACIHIKTDR